MQYYAPKSQPVSTAPRPEPVLPVEGPPPPRGFAMGFLGSSPVTSMLGYVVIGATVANEVITEQGLPHNAEGWTRLVVGVITGIALRFAKDGNVSNSPHPGAAKPVDAPPVNG